MTALRARGLAALILVVAAVGCKKEGASDTAELPSEFRPHPAHGDPAALVVPPLLASVPADTPYLMASLDAVPPGFYAKLKQAFGPMVDQMSQQWQRQGQESKLFGAILAELDGKWNQAGLESLGFSTEPRFAIYGLGLWPVVARLAVKDHKRVQATIERVAARAGESLPPMATRDGRNYWRVANADGTAVVVALADNQVIAALGRAADIDAALGQILGIDKPARSLADGKLVKELMARHGFGGQLIGFADTRQIAGKALEAAGAKPAPACTAEIDRLSAKAPRLVFGYGELSASKVSGGTVLELAPDAAAGLKALKTEIPGLTAALAGDTVFTMGGGVDLGKAQQLGIAIAGQLKQLGAACAIGPLVDGADEVIGQLSGQLPEPLGRISGGVIAVDSVSFGPAGARGGMPQTVEAIALLASPDARALFDKALVLAPPLKDLGVAADGKLHDLAKDKLPAPFPVAAGVGDKLIVLTAGSQRRALAEKLIGSHGGGKAPLLAMSYDFARLIDLEMQGMGLKAALRDPAMRAMFDSMRNVFGRVSGSMDVTGQGLAFWGTLELK
jgi:hypothetical protein